MQVQMAGIFTIMTNTQTTYTPEPDDEFGYAMEFPSMADFAEAARESQRT